MTEVHHSAYWRAERRTSTRAARGHRLLPARGNEPLAAGSYQCGAPGEQNGLWTVKRLALHRYRPELKDKREPGSARHPRSPLGRPADFHSEADFQHSLAWHIQREHPDAAIRLETRPERGIRLDVLVDHAGERTAVELKYLSARFLGAC